MSRFRLLRGRSWIELGELLNKGGEGSVYRVKGRPNAVVKEYHAPLSKDRADKILAMVCIDNAKLRKCCAWPTDVVLNNNGATVGMLMPLLPDLKDVHEVYSPQGRLASFPDADWGFLVRTAENTARAFASVHAAGCVIGDVNHGSVGVSKDATVSLFDCDSFQISVNGKRYTCDVGTSLFLPPEVQYQSLRDLPRIANHDNFGLAVLIFQILFMGRHPFAGRFRGGAEITIEKAIQEYRYAYSRDPGRTEMAPPDGMLSPEIASTPVMLMFERAFSQEGTSRLNRPSAADWTSILWSLGERLRGCSRNGNHSYLNTLKSCPWCEFERQYNADPFAKIHPDRSRFPRAAAAQPAKVRKVDVTTPPADPASILARQNAKAPVAPPPPATSRPRVQVINAPIAPASTIATPPAKAPVVTPAPATGRSLVRVNNAPTATTPSIATLPAKAPVVPPPPATSQPRTQAINVSAIVAPTVTSPVAKTSSTTSALVVRGPSVSEPSFPMVFKVSMYCGAALFIVVSLVEGCSSMIGYINPSAEEVDRNLYANLVETRTMEAADAYINQAPLGRMNDDVEAFKTFSGSTYRIYMHLQENHPEPHFLNAHQCTATVNDNNVFECRDGALIAENRFSHVIAIGDEVSLHVEGYDINRGFIARRFGLKQFSTEITAVFEPGMDEMVFPVDLDGTISNVTLDLHGVPEPFEFPEWGMAPDHPQEGGESALIDPVAAIDAEIDRALYTNLVENKTIEAANTYINEAPLGSMNDNVETFIVFLNSLYIITLYLRENHPAQPFSDTYQCNATIDGEDIFECRDGALIAVGEVPQVIAIGDVVSLHVEGYDADRGYLARLFGTKQFSIEIAAVFEPGMDEMVFPVDLDGTISNVTLDMFGVPEPFEFPEWRAPDLAEQGG